MIDKLTDEGRSRPDLSEFYVPFDVKRPGSPFRRALSRLLNAKHALLSASRTSWLIGISVIGVLSFIVLHVYAFYSNALTPDERRWQFYETDEDFKASSWNRADLSQTFLQKLMNRSLRTDAFLRRLAIAEGQPAPVPSHLPVELIQELDHRVRLLPAPLLKFIDERVIDVTFSYSMSDAMAKAVSIPDESGHPQFGIIVLDLEGKAPTSHLARDLRPFGTFIDGTWEFNPEGPTYPFDGEAGFLFEIFLHELGHVIAHVSGTLPSAKAANSWDVYEKYEWVGASWRCPDGTCCCDLGFGRMGLDVALSPELLKSAVLSLGAKDSVSFYGALNPSEDFAETFVAFIRADIFHQRRDVVVKKDGKLVLEWADPYFKEAMLRKRHAINSVYQTKIVGDIEHSSSQ